MPIPSRSSLSSTVREIAHADQIRLNKLICNTSNKLECRPFQQQNKARSRLRATQRSSRGSNSDNPSKLLKLLSLKLVASGRNLELQQQKWLARQHTMSKQCPHLQVRAMNRLQRAHAPTRLQITSALRFDHAAVIALRCTARQCACATERVHAARQMSQCTRAHAVCHSCTDSLLLCALAGCACVHYRIGQKIPCTLLPHRRM